MRALIHRRTPLLNPYVVVADVAINLLLIVVAYFLVSARLTDAVYAAQERQFRAVVHRLPALRKECRVITRNGSQLYFRIPDRELFPSDDNQLSPSGRRALAELASLINRPDLKSEVRAVRITVTYPMDWSMAQAASQQAEILADALRRSHVHPIIPSGRSQRNTQVKDASVLAETEIALELQTKRLRSRAASR